MERHPEQPHHALGRRDRRVSVFRKPSNYANGNTRDRQGRLISCEHDTRRVTRTEYDGTITVLADKFEGKPLNSPNDVVVKSDGSIWFTDPPFGILGNYEGHVATPELPTNVYRVDASGRTTVVDRRHQSAEWARFLARRIEALRRRGRAQPARDPGVRRGRRGTKLTNKRPFINAEPAVRPTAFASMSTATCGAAGAWAPKQDGVKIFNPDGKLIGRIALPERCANVCFGGVKRNRLFMAASHSVYSLFVNTQGVKGG